MVLDDSDRLGLIRPPPLILWGERDAFIPREVAERMAASVRRAELRVYPETGRLPHWEGPEWVTADIDAFVRAALR